MRPIDRSEIRDAAIYERIRAEARREMIELKSRRRVRVGQSVSLVFLNRATVLHQLQEGLRAERIIDESAIAREIQIANELLPPRDGLVGELYIELSNSERIREDLERFAGLDRGDHLRLEMGEAGRFSGQLAPAGGSEGRLACVYSVRFQLGAEGARWFRDPAKPVLMVIDHPGYSARAPVEGAARRAIAEDLLEA